MPRLLLTAIVKMKIVLCLFLKLDVVNTASILLQMFTDLSFSVSFALWAQKEEAMLCVLLIVSVANEEVQWHRRMD